MQGIYRSRRMAAHTSGAVRPATDRVHLFREVVDLQPGAVDSAVRSARTCDGSSGWWFVCVCARVCVCVCARAPMVVVEN